MIYIALLRGINVGGNNKIDMKTLKRTFESKGMQRVVTYINSGNIVFRNDEFTKPQLTEVLARAIADDFALSIKVLILSMDEYRKVLEALPDSWTNDDMMKSEVMFLWEEADDATVLEKLEIKADIDQVIYAPGAVLWSVGRSDAARSGIQKLIGTKLYRQMTIRNVNTTRKIFELMQAADK